MLDLAQKVNRAKAIIDGMVVSGYNLVVFANEPEVWFQLYLGAWLEKPTVCLVETKDIGFKRRLEESIGVKKIIKVKNFEGMDKEQIASEIEKFVKEDHEHIDK